jgi:hypothetical protein
MGAIGELMLSWGYLEATVLRRLKEIAPTKLHSRTPLILRWRGAELDRAARPEEIAGLLSELDEAAAVRNCVAHGLRSATVERTSAKYPSVGCETVDGSHRTISLAELLEATSRIDRLRHRIEGLA